MCKVRDLKKDLGGREGWVKGTSTPNPPLITQKNSWSVQLMTSAYNSLKQRFVPMPVLRDYSPRYMQENH